MTVYSYAQLEQLWINAGGSKSLAPMAAAIAEAESGGNSAAMNYTDNGGTQTSVGLWQVSTGTHQFPAAWTTPSGNAAEAVAKYTAAGGWSPWGTYDSGAYKQFLSGSTTPDPNVPGGTAAGGGTTAQTTAAEQAAAAAASTQLGSTCLIGFGGVPGTSWVNDIFGSGGNVGQFCILSKSEVRALLGGLIIAAGGLVAITGVLILAAYGLKRSGALDKAANVAAVVPGGQGVAAGLALASNRSQQTGQGVLRQRQAAERESAREAKAARKAPAQDETA